MKTLKNTATLVLSDADMNAAVSHWLNQYLSVSADTVRVIDVEYDQGAETFHIEFEKDPAGEEE